MELKPEELEKITLPETGELTPNYSATVGETLADGTPHATQDEIIAALRAVNDPELMMNIYELGLIYEINQLENGDVKIMMTLTSPTCPVAGEMPSMAANAVASVPGVGCATVELTFDPPWTMDRLSDEIKMIMGLE